jgi:hypothetical protein
MAGGALIAAREQAARPQLADHTPVYCCECGHVLQVFGRGRHRVYFEPSNQRLDDPVMDGACTQCGHGLPGKNRL